MRSKRSVLIGLLTLVFLCSCVSYHGISKVGDQVYLTGSEVFIFFGESWVKRCQEKGKTLVCETLKVKTSKAQRAEEEEGVRERFDR